MRLRRSTDFERVVREHTGSETAHFRVRYLVTGDPPRFGLTVSRKVGNAVTRNRLKRWLREAIRHRAGPFSGADVVFIAKNRAAQTRFDEVCEEVQSLLRWVEGRCEA